MADTTTCAFIFNNDTYEAKHFQEIYRKADPSLYEVIRLVEGRPLFLEEHYERLVKSGKSIGFTIGFSLEELRERILSLASSQEIENQNVKLVINNLKENPQGDFYLYFIPSSYPTLEMYRDGVDTDLFRAMRENPQAKIINQSLRDATNAFIAEKSLFEAVLVNDDGEITEGSRSNIAFVKNGEIYTSPAAGVLLGVTRQRILRICGENAIPVHEVPIKADSISEFSGAFVCGTSPKILPIRRMGEVSFDVSDPTLRRLMRLYDDEMKESLSGYDRK